MGRHRWPLVLVAEQHRQRQEYTTRPLDAPGSFRAGPSPPARPWTWRWSGPAECDRHAVVRHADVLPHCSAVITHGGHGTVMKALIAGVPLIVVPLGRDQPDNAARVVYAGAGIRLRKNASVRALHAATGRVIEDPRYRAAAGRMASRLAAERDDNLAVDELEHVAAGARAAVGGAAPPLPGDTAGADRTAGR